MKVREKKKQQLPDDGNNIVENDMNTMLDALADFEDFREQVLPAIQKDLKAGLSASELRQKYVALLQARQITDALMAPVGEGADIAQKILDRELGKAKEQVETTHKLEQLPDQQLDAILQTKLKKLQDEEQKH